MPTAGNVLTSQKCWTGGRVSFFWGDKCRTSGDTHTYLVGFALRETKNRGRTTARGLAPTQGTIPLARAGLSPYGTLEQPPVFSDRCSVIAEVPRLPLRFRNCQSLTADDG